MNGRRVHDSEDFGKPGDYMKCENGHWLIIVPTGIRGTIKESTWNIVEHKDDTITVSPSILVTSHNPKYDWHGYLEKGIWRSC